MFKGLQDGKLLAKNRVVFPEKFRDLTGDKLLITNWLENSIAVLPFDDLDALISDWKAESILLPEIRDIERFIFSGIETVELDNLGRFVVPKRLIQHAKLERDIVFVGSRSRIELWSRDLWDSYYQLISIQGRQTAIKIFEGIEERKSK